MCMKASFCGKLILVFSVAVQGLMFRRLFHDFYLRLEAYQPHSDAPSVQHKDLNKDIHLHMDVMVPTFERDDRIQVFASHLGKAISDYHRTPMGRDEPRISTFRLLLTRFTPEERASSQTLRRDLAALANHTLDNIVMVQAPEEANFSRARALNLLHDAACHRATCLVTRVDVDMEVRSQFFQHAVEAVYLRQVPPLDEFNADFQTSSLPDGTPTVYFPIVWSAYNPSTIELVEREFRQEESSIAAAIDESEDNSATIDRRMAERLPEFSEHRGHWRPYGKGMYVILGSDAVALRFDTTFEGWGGEDVNFYNRTENLPRRILRRIEPGLIHAWHAKSCGRGKDTFTDDQVRNCESAKRREEGSELGRTLLGELRREEAEKEKARQKELETEKPQEEEKRAKIKRNVYKIITTKTFKKASPSEVIKTSKRVVYGEGSIPTNRQASPPVAPSKVAPSKVTSAEVAPDADSIPIGWNVPLPVAAFKRPLKVDDN